MKKRIHLRGEILAAARAEYVKYGLAGARLDRIAAAAHIARERLYTHFGGKEALFRMVMAADTADFFRALTMRPDAVAEFVGDVFDLGRTRHDHLRMLMWARLEGLEIDGPQRIGHNVPARELATIVAAQNAGYVDVRWEPMDLLVILFGIGMAWAQWPQQDVNAQDPADVEFRRAAAIAAAARVIAPGVVPVGAPDQCSPGRPERPTG